MADFLLDRDVVIWHLRGRESVVQQVIRLSARGRIGLSAITRAEIVAGMRESEETATMSFLDACETIPVDMAVADRGGEIRRSYGIRLD